MGMKNFDVKSIEVFGLQPKQNSWYDMIANSDFESLDKHKFETALKWNVELGYYRLCSASLIDLDTDIEYVVWFFNSKRVWNVDIANSKDPNAVSPEEKKALFSNPLVKKIIARTYDVLIRASKIYTEKVQPHIEAGELLGVDENKADAVIWFIEDTTLMNNLKKGLYLK